MEKSNRHSKSTIVLIEIGKIKRYYSNVDLESLDGAGSNWENLDFETFENQTDVAFLFKPCGGVIVIKNERSHCS